MLRRWTFFLSAFVLVAATASGDTDPANAATTKHSKLPQAHKNRMLQEQESVKLLQVITFCLEAFGGTTYRTQVTLGVFWHLYNMLSTFADVQVFAPGMSCEALRGDDIGFDRDAGSAAIEVEVYEEANDGEVVPDEFDGGDGIGAAAPYDEPAGSGAAVVEEPPPLPNIKVPTDNNIVITFVDANVNNVFAMDNQALAALYSQDTPFGVWYWARYVPDKANKSIYPGLRGGPILLHWNELETMQGTYDWSQVDSYMDAAVAEGLYYSLELLVGPSSPEWLYQRGVPKVFTTAEGWQFPYYFDPLYLESFDKLTEEAVSHLKALPADRAKALSKVILNDGSTGDPYCYKGDPLDNQYAISKEEWDVFRREHFQAVHDYLGPDGLESIELAVVHVSDETAAFINNLFANAQYFKNGMASHGYHIAEDEQSVINVQRSKAFDGDPALNGARIRWFGEMDREWLNGWFQQAPVESFWWSSIYALHMGLSHWHVRGDALEVKEYHFAFDFFNKHSPYIDAKTSPYAFCALREGLDASDTVKFGETKYGTVQGRSLSRVLNILNDYASYGAVVEDITVTGGGPMQFRQRSDYVDVIYGGVAGNYHHFLYQIDPSVESIGWWHVGSQQWPYGRFARSFEASSGMNAMYFRLDKHFISNKSVSHSAKVSVTYFDEGNGEWDLLYKDPVEGMQSAVTVTCSGTQSWKKVQIVLPSAMFDGSLHKGADLILQHNSGTDTKFHMIELDRLDY